MGKIITYFSVGSSAFALTLSLSGNILLSLAVCLLCLVLLYIGFRIEAYVHSNGNRILNKIVYFFTKNEKKFNIDNKEIKYTYLGNNTYEFQKRYELKPKVTDLDRMYDRFSWSVPSAGYVITATEKGHVVNQIWQQETWNCYTVYFNEYAKKNKSYPVTSVISNLIDTNGVAAPYLSNTIDKKTKSTTMLVVFPNNDHPLTAKFKAFPGVGMDSNTEDEIAYDEGVGGFKKTIPFPRKGWRYVISWEK